MESAAYGCATITSGKGGLKETFDNDLILRKLNYTELFKINQKIDFKRFIKKNSKKNFSNVIHKLSKKVQKIDNLKFYLLNNKINFITNKKLKILHISNLMKEMILDS